MSTMDEIKRQLDRLKKYRDGKILGFPGSEPLTIAREAFSYAMEFNPNAIGLHYGKIQQERERDRESEVFGPIHEMECHVLRWLAELLYEKDGNNKQSGEGNKESSGEGNKDRIWGYITSGGTESNIFSLWVARNYFQQKFKNKPIQVFVPWCDATHYSIFKALNLLSLTRTNDNGYEEGLNENLHYIPLDQYGYPNYDEISSELVRYNDNPILFIINAPSINTGLIDNIRFIRSILDKTIENKERIWIHIDGAFGMFFIPFLSSDDYNRVGCRIICDFYNAEKEKISLLRFPHINSISVDLHKMGLLPYPAGVVLIKNPDLIKYIQRRASYISGEYDETLLGSRPGASAVAAYAAMMELNRDGYRNIMFNCLKLTSKFIKFFSSYNKIFQIVGRPITNIFAVKFSDYFIKVYNNSQVLQDIVRNIWMDEIVRRFTIIETPLRPNTTSPTTNESGFDISKIAWRFVIMPHVTDEVFEKFIDKSHQFILYCQIVDESLLGP